MQCIAYRNRRGAKIGSGNITAAVFIDEAIEAPEQQGVLTGVIGRVFRCDEQQEVLPVPGQHVIIIQLKVLIVLQLLYFFYSQETDAYRVFADHAFERNAGRRAECAEILFQGLFNRFRSNERIDRFIIFFFKVYRQVAADGTEQFHRKFIIYLIIDLPDKGRKCSPDAFHKAVCISYQAVGLRYRRRIFHGNRDRQLIHELRVLENLVQFFDLLIVGEDAGNIFFKLQLRGKPGSHQEKGGKTSVQNRFMPAVKPVDVK